MISGLTFASLNGSVINYLRADRKLQSRLRVVVSVVVIFTGSFASKSLIRLYYKILQISTAHLTFVFWVKLPINFVGL